MVYVFLFGGMNPTLRLDNVSCETNLDVSEIPAFAGMTGEILKQVQNDKRPPKTKN